MKPVAVLSDILSLDFDLLVFNGGYRFSQRDALPPVILRQVKTFKSGGFIGYQWPFTWKVFLDDFQEQTNNIGKLVTKDERYRNFPVRFNEVRYGDLDNRHKKFSLVGDLTSYDGQGSNEVKRRIMLVYEPLIYKEMKLEDFDYGEWVLH